MKTILTTAVFDAWYQSLPALKVRKRDSAEYLKTEEDMADYLEVCFQEFATILKVISALGIQLHTQAQPHRT